MKVFVLVCVLALAGLSAADEPSLPTLQPADEPSLPTLPPADEPSLPTLPPAFYPTHSRGCLYIMGRCITECDEGTHAYALGCGYMTPEPTCAQPHPEAEPYMTCDYSACYCDAPTVRDTASGTCVPLDQCPNKA